jgi:isopenicillin-N epimerase
LVRHWTLDPGIVFLNHGSFGACPRPVLEQQSALRAEMEREPIRWFVQRSRRSWMRRGSRWRRL